MFIVEERLKSPRPINVKVALIVAVLVCGMWPSWADDKYYVQLIKATNQSDPPAKGAKAVGTKLGEKLSPLRWKHYWEIERRDTTVANGKTRKVALSGERAIEIAPRGEGKVEVRLYRGKQIARKSCHKANDHMMAIFGGDEGQRAWFIVVRRQEPKYELAKH